MVMAWSLMRDNVARESSGALIQTSMQQASVCSGEGKL